MPNYQNGKIYKLVSDKDDRIYIGSTVEKLCKRMSKHRYDVKNGLCKVKCKWMEDCGDCRIVLIKLHPCNTYEELLMEEEATMKQFKKEGYELINNNKAYQTIEELKEYMKEYNKSDKMKSYKKEYHKTDKYKESQKKSQKKYNKSDKGKECRKEYQKSDKRKEYEKSDKRKESNKEYRETDKRKEYMKEWVFNKKIERWLNEWTYILRPLKN